MCFAPAAGKAKKQILIVDDHPLLRDGLAQVINQQREFEVCGAVGNAREALAWLARRPPAAAIVDLSLNEGTGLDLIQDIRRRHPGLPVLVLSMHPEALYAERAFHAGAQGYVNKHEPVGHVLAALRKVFAGHLAFSDGVVSRLLGPPRRKLAGRRRRDTDALSDRELEVFQLLGEGNGTRQIARRLRVAPSTVETYRAAIKRKLGLAGATELVARAARFVADQAAG